MEETVARGEAARLHDDDLRPPAPDPELSSDNFRIRQMGERMAQNAPVQGSAADIFKLAMIDLDRALEDGGFATPDAAHRARRARLRGAARRARAASSPSSARRWSRCAELRVPLVVDIGFGPNWAEAK